MNTIYRDLGGLLKAAQVANSNFIVNDCHITFEISLKALIEATSKLKISKIEFQRVGFSSFCVDAWKKEYPDGPQINFSKCEFKASSSTSREHKEFFHLKIHADYPLNFIKENRASQIEVGEIDFPTKSLEALVYGTIFFNKTIFNKFPVRLGGLASPDHFLLDKAVFRGVNIPFSNGEKEICVTSHNLIIEDSTFDHIALIVEKLFIKKSNLSSLDIKMAAKTKKLELYIENSSFQYVPELVSIDVPKHVVIDGITFSQENLCDAKTHAYENQFETWYDNLHIPISWRLKHLESLCEQANLYNQAVKLNSYYHLAELKNSKKSAIETSREYLFIRFVSKVLQTVNNHGLNSYAPFVWLFVIWLTFTPLYNWLGLTDIWIDGTKSPYIQNLCGCGEAALYSGRLTLLGAFANFSDNQPFMPTTTAGAVISMFHQLIATWLWYIAIVTLRRRFSL